jgi:hypothetical protein
MKFSAKDAKDLETEFEETKVPRIYMANLVGVNQAYITQYISGVRQPTDDVIRKMRAVFTMIRAEHMRTGGFALDAKGMSLLRKRLAEMERSIVRSARPTNDDGEENQKCQAAN